MVKGYMLRIKSKDESSYYYYDNSYCDYSCFVKGSIGMVFNTLKEVKYCIKSIKEDIKRKSFYVFDFEQEKMNLKTIEMVKVVETEVKSFKL